MVVQRLGDGADMTITTGTDMLDTFTGDFLSRAFPFVYKSQLGQPDSTHQASLRKQKGGPEVNLAHHANCMNRRVEHQFRGDWAHSYTAWNLCFREKLNRSRMMYAVHGVFLCDDPRVEIGHKYARVPF